MFLNLYKSLVRPHLEYGSAVWGVIYKHDAVSMKTYRDVQPDYFPTFATYHIQKDYVIWVYQRYSTDK